MKRTLFAALVAVLMIGLTACGSTPNADKLDASGPGGVKSKMSLAAGDASAESEQNDKAFNLGGSYLGDNKQMTSSIYGARKSSTPSWGGTLQAGVIQGAQSAKDLKDSLAAAMTGDPVLLGLIARQKILLESLAAATTPEEKAAANASLDGLVPMLEAAMTRVHDSVRVASGGDLRNLKAIIIGSMSHNGNVVGADSLGPAEGEFEAYGEAFKGLPAVLESIMGDGGAGAAE